MFMKKSFRDNRGRKYCAHYSFSYFDISRKTSVTNFRDVVRNFNFMGAIILIGPWEFKSIGAYYLLISTYNESRWVQLDHC